MSVDWSSVFRATYEDLVRYLHRHVWDADRAQDLAQETFVRAMRKNPADPRALLFTVALNLARDEARTAIRRKRHLALLKADADRPAATPEDDMEKREMKAVVQRALNKLNDTEREAILLWDAGLDYDEIARHTGLSARSVGTTLNRARKKLIHIVHGSETKNAAHR